MIIASYSSTVVIQGQIIEVNSKTVIQFCDFISYKPHLN